MGFENLAIITYSVPIQIGGSCRITCQVDYSGSAVTKKLHAAIGNYGTWGFDEILNGEKSWSFPASSSPVRYELWVDIPITSAIDPSGNPYDLYAKLDGVFPDIESPVYQNLINVEGGEPEPPEEIFQNLIVTGYDSPVDIGGNCRVTVRFDYQGPAQTLQLYAALGNSGWAGFDEIIHGTANLSLPETASLQSRTASVSIPVTAAIDPDDSPYDLYAKITGKIVSPTYNNVVTVTGGVPAEEFQNLRVMDATTPVKQGNVCTVQVAFEYQGPAQSRVLYAALGNYGFWGFDEIVAGQTTISVPESTSLQTFYRNVNITVTTAVNPDDSPYDLYAKIVGGISSPTAYDVVWVTGEPTPPDPEFRNCRITNYNTPVSPGEVCTIRVSFEYQGPAKSAEVHAAIGNYGFFGFDEILNGQDFVSIPDTISWQTYYADIPINIVSGLSADDSPYDLYAKVDGNQTPVIQDVLYVRASAGEPEYDSFRISSYDSPVQIGGVCRITVSTEYRGPAATKTLHVAIGNNGTFGFDEIISKDVSVNFPASDSWTPQTFTVTVQVVGVSTEDAPYDLYAKIGGVFPEVEAPILNNVLGIEGGGPGAYDIVGALTNATPLSFEAGSEVKILVSYSAYTDDPQAQLAWQTRVVISAGSLQGEVTFDHFGPEADQTGLEVDCGAMPESSQTGSIRLDGRKQGDDWHVLNELPVTINIPGEGNGEGMGALGWVALAAVAAVAIAGGGSEKKAKPKAKPRAKARS